MIVSRTQLVSHIHVVALSSLLAVGVLYVAAAVWAQETATSPPDDEGQTTVPSKAERMPPQFDPELIAKGKAAFYAKCTTCHDADRTLGKKKQLGGWKTCVRRMAEKDGAEILPGDVDGITAYIASICSPANGEAGTDVKSVDEDESNFAMFGTFSPVWRGGGGPNVQYNQFFPDMFIGGQWKGKVLSARITACTACHGVGEDAGASGGFLSRVELVEAAVKLDLATLLTGTCPRAWQMAVDAGRFVVPFGAFSAQVNPGVYRTVSKPLMFNMGQRVIEGDIGDPVLPMPFSDEGASLNGSMTLFTDGGTDPITMTYNGYIVNGLKGGQDGINFDTSRDIVTQNNSPSVGGRATIGNRWVRFGSSVIGGRFNDKPVSDDYPGRQNYLIYGFDATARYENMLRFQFEYAQRNTDYLVAAAAPPVSAMTSVEKVCGYYFELEGRRCNESKLSLIGRWDHMNRNVAPSALNITEVNRITYGLNYAVTSNSLFMINHEIWRPINHKHIDVFGVRYAVTF